MKANKPNQTKYKNPNQLCARLAWAENTTKNITCIWHHLHTIYGCFFRHSCFPYGAVDEKCLGVYVCFWCAEEVNFL